MLQSIDTALRETQALVLSPTRELATQIQNVVLALGDYMNVGCHACIGELVVELEERGRWEREKKQQRRGCDELRQSELDQAAN